MWVRCEVNTLIVPPLPAGTSAEFIVIAPSSAFRVETTGWPPAPHNERKPIVVMGATVAFNKYAVAVSGTAQLEPVTRKSRLTAAAIGGPPKGPSGLWVSIIRQGVCG